MQLILQDTQREKLEEMYLEILSSGVDIEDILMHGFGGIKNMSDMELFESVEDLSDGLDDVEELVREIRATLELEKQIKNAK